MKETTKIDTIEAYNQCFGLKTRHPLVSVVDLSQTTQWPDPLRFSYGIYALFLKQVKCGNIQYGRQTYDYQDGTIICFAPGQVAEVTSIPGARPSAYGLLFHPDLIHGTALGQEIKRYSFFSYAANEALHLSEEERQTILDTMRKIDRELDLPFDKHSRRLITAHIGVLLDYCMRFYDRQFATRSEVNNDVITCFEQLLDGYFDTDAPQHEGLPSVRYFSDKVCLSPNYFGDLIRKLTGKTASEHIQDRLIDRVKELLLSSGKTMSQIAYELGFQHPQHLSRMFKRLTGMTPNEYRSVG
ncbi:AraC family transcriptional regulator [uncultured Rikenella sp.]|uniref:helix-turn-helix domain-containing protein n=1 Tax=uncultured Rikenella sp. TaxID=368003 RepID=UPI0025FEDCD2|nr:helix-turn-helix domain-containing protein [uncultured Rikenella sp.]